jgi:GT2 family glycosyltransferase
VTTAILVLSVDEAHMLRHCLPAAAAQPGAELVVIDNACTDATAALAREHGARVVTLSPRRSYAAAMNAGLAALGPAGAVLLLNADCFLDPGFLAAALPRLQEPTVGSVAGKLLRVAGPDAAPDAIDAAGMWIDRRRKNGLVGHGAPLSAYAERAEVFGADGACALYRREVLDACGPEVFDEDMALWATDADLAWRVRRLGVRSVYEPAATARHVRTYSPSKRVRTSQEHRRIQFRNRYLMMARNESARSLLANLPWILAYEMLALGHVLLRERFLAAGYREAWRLAPRVRAKRARDQPAVASS